jgi:hypothetical protein
MNRRSSKGLTVAIVLSIATGCGGGGTPASEAPNGSARVSAQAFATILVPAKQVSADASRRRPAWVSPSSKLISISAIRSDGWSETTTQGLTPTTNGCTLQGNGSTLCVVPFAAPATASGQSDEFQVALYDAVSSYLSNIVCYGDTKGNVVASGAQNNFAVVLGGVIGTVGLPNGTSAQVTTGTPSSLSVPVTFTDADGNVIGGAFDAPATVTLSGAAAASFSVTPVTIPDPTKLPGGAIVLKYDGSGTKGTSATVTISSNSAQDLFNFGFQQSISLTITLN